MDLLVGYMSTVISLGLDLWREDKSPVDVGV